MRIACVYPNTPMWPKYRWVHAALKAIGHEAWQVRNREELREADHTADLVILPQKEIAIRWPNLKDIAEQHRATWINWWFDLILTDSAKPLSEQAYLKTSLLLMRSCKRVFVKEIPLLSQYRDLGIQAEYMDQGSPSHWPLLETTPEFDVLAWGQGGPTYNERTKAVQEIVKAGYTVAWAGHGLLGTRHLPWFKADDFPAVAARARVLLHVSRRNDLDGYTSDGFWMACATGRPVVKKAYPGMPPGPYQVFHDSHDLQDAVKRALEQDGREVREWALANHTIEHRCRQLLEIVQSARCAAAPAR